MDLIGQMQEVLLRLVRSNVPVQVVYATCKTVGQDSMTAEREGVEYHDVLLGLGGHKIRPMPGSSVMLALIENRPEATVLLYAEKVEGQTLNGDKYGGLVRAATVRSVDTQLIAKVNALVAALNAWTPTMPMPTVLDLVTLKAAFATWATPMQPAEPTSYENSIVKHG